MLCEYNENLTEEEESKVFKYDVISSALGPIGITGLYGTIFLASLNSPITTLSLGIGSSLLLTGAYKLIKKIDKIEEQAEIREKNKVLSKKMEKK